MQKEEGSHPDGSGRNIDTNSGSMQMELFLQTLHWYWSLIAQVDHIKRKGETETLLSGEVSLSFYETDQRKVLPFFYQYS